MNRSPRHLAAAAALIFAVLLAACGGDGDTAADPAGADDASSASTAGDDAAGDESAGADEVVATDADLDLPRTVTYAGVEITLTGARFSNATPASVAADDPVAGDDELLYLEVTTDFEEGFPGDDGFFPIGNFSITTADGTDLVARGLDMAAELPVKAGAATSAVLVIDATPDDLEGASFVYDDGSRLAAVLPLTDDVPDEEYPLRTEVGEVVTVDFKTGCNPSPAELTLVALEWDVDAGVGADGKKLVAGRSSRTLADERWLRVDLSVVARAGECGGTYPNHEQFRLSVDGLVEPPVNSYSLTLADGAGADLSFVYDVPVDATEVVLVAGVDGATTHEFTVEVPELP